MLFYSPDRENTQGPGEMGYLTAMNRDGNSSQVLEERHSSGFERKVSPHGQSLAATGRLYRRGSVVLEPDFEAQGLPDDAAVWLVSPAWSPDGRRIA